MKLNLKDFRKLWILLAVAAMALPVAARPAARAKPVMVWHEAKERIVLFGGETRRDSSLTRYYLNDTWEWNGKLWVQTYPSTPPTGRAGHAMVYDSVRERIVLFGGHYGPDPEVDDAALLLNDTWELVDDSWQPIESTVVPPVRQLAGYAFDPGNDRMVVYGGYGTDGAALQDTWVLEGSEWRQLETSIDVNNPSMVHDPVRHQTLMLGSDDEGNTLMYELVGETWEQLTPENLPPCVRFSAMTFEKRFTRVVFQGGACSSAPTVSETWLWHGDDWAKLSPFPTPGRVTGFGLANDPIRQETVMFGGVDFQERSSTYAFRNNQWSFQFENQVPGGRSLFAFAADPDRNAMWLFGGLDDVGDLLNDFFMLRGGVWSRIRLEDGPPFCFNPLGVYDKDRQRFVLVCDSTDVWEWDGEQWYDFSDVETQPGDRRFAALVYDESLKKTVLFGGYDEFNYLREVWLWDGSTWTEVETRDKDSPPARGLPAMFYDPNSSQTIIFGGIGRPKPEDAIRRYEDMWSFNGSSWTELTPANKPSARYGPQTGWDPTTNRIVMFGGKNELEIYINEQWAWNGSAWTEITPQNPPSPRMNGRMAVDPITGKLMLYGGYAGYYFSEIWSVEDNVWTVHPYRSSRAARPVRPPVNEPAGERLPMEKTEE